jgi:hypothetical protein
MANSGIDVGSISSLKVAVGTLRDQLEDVLGTAKKVTEAGDSVVTATGNSTTTANAFSSEVQTLHSDEFKSAQTSLQNYITFLSNSYDALEEAEQSMSSNTKTYASTGGC